MLVSRWPKHDHGETFTLLPLNLASSTETFFFLRLAFKLRVDGDDAKIKRGPRGDPPLSWPHLAASKAPAGGQRREVGYAPTRHHFCSSKQLN
jgi:hypothetical protein